MPALKTPADRVLTPALGGALSPMRETHRGCEPKQRKGCASRGRKELLLTGGSWKASWRRGQQTQDWGVGRNLSGPAGKGPGEENTEGRFIYFRPASPKMFLIINRDQHIPLYLICFTKKVIIKMAKAKHHLGARFKEYKRLGTARYLSPGVLTLPLAGVRALSLGRSAPQLESGWPGKRALSKRQQHQSKACSLTSIPFLVLRTTQRRRWDRG